VAATFSKVKGPKPGTGKPTSPDDAPPPANEGPAGQQSYRDEVAQKLQALSGSALSGSAFERFCQRLLRESGFQEVSITGRSGDGGIDGIGILQVNALVSFKVLFQCKRYVGSVTVAHVRDFRGAMAGRADKGIIITTGSFTAEARKEAVRDGVPPIELVDGEKLIGMLEQRRPLTRSIQVSLRASIDSGSLNKRLHFSPAAVTSGQLIGPPGGRSK